MSTIASAARCDEPAPSALGGAVGVLVNGLSGSGADRAPLVEACVNAIDRAGGRLLAEPAGRTIAEQVADLEGTTPDLLIAMGGDGTVNAAASLAVRTGAAVLVVPTGTMNLIARDLHLPIDPELIIGSAAELTVLRVDSSSANGRVFLHTATIGVVPEMSRARERMRSADDLGATLSHVPELARSAFGAEPIELRIEASGLCDVHSTRSVAVSNNPLAGEGVISHARRSVAAGRLGVYASAHRGPLASLKLLASLGTGGLARDPETISTSCTSLVIHAQAESIRVSLDGEVHELTPPLRFEMHPRSLRVARPAALLGGVDA